MPLVWVPVIGLRVNYLLLLLGLFYSHAAFVSVAAFPTQAERAMDPRQALAFDPVEERTSSFSKLRSLDLFPALGLAASDFWPLFSRCLACHNLMTTRTAPYHICQDG